MRILILAALILVIALPTLAADETPEMATLEGEHIIFKARSDDMKQLKDPQTWVANLDKIYEGYAELVGTTPFKGEKITILVTDDYPGGWAVSGNPIQWYRGCFLESIEAINKGDWMFGILHEIGHDFDLDDRWNWHAEMFANFKMDYAAEHAKAVIFAGEDICDYGDPKSMRLTDAYRKSEVGIDLDLIMTGDVGEDQFHRRLSELVSEFGWEPFKKVFRWFNSLSPEEIQSDPLNRRSLFIRSLEEQSGVRAVDRFLNWGYSYVAVDAKDANAAARILQGKDWYAYVVQRPINAAPGEKVTVCVDVAERNPIQFKKGLGTHAPSEIVYDLGGKYKTFESYIGVIGGCDGTVGFELMADGKKVFESPTINGRGSYRHVTQDVSGVNELKLITNIGNNRNNYCDICAWADTKLTDSDGKVTYLSDLKPISEKQEYAELHLDTDIDGNPLEFSYCSSSRPVKIIGEVDGKTIELRRNDVTKQYEYTFDKGFDKGIHRVHLTIKIGDSPITQHEFVKVIVK